MPIVSIKIAKGRPTETKRKLVQAVTEAVSSPLDLSQNLITVLFEEFDRENWSTDEELHVDKFGNGFGSKQ